MEPSSPSDSLVQQPHPQEGAIAAWARFVTRHKWPVLGVSLATIIAVAVIALTFGGSYVDSFTVPGSEVQQAIDLLDERFPSQAGDSATIVFQDDQGIAAPSVASQIDAFGEQAARLPGVTGVVSPYQNPAAIGQDGTTAYMMVQYGQQASEIPAASTDALLDLVDGAGSGDLVVEAGGQVIAVTEQSDPGTSELYGVGAAIIILLIAFGSVVAMGVPIVTALLGLGTTILLTLLLANFLDFGTFAPAFASMIGLGVGIDYALLIVTRFREELHHGQSLEDSIARAIDTSGRAISFAGIVVIICLLGLWLMGIPFIGLLGTAGALSVAVAVIVAMTLLPALLAVIGHRIDRLSLPGLRYNTQNENAGIWRRLSLHVQTHPWWYAVTSTLFLLLLAVPLLDVQIGTSDAGNNSESFYSRRAYDLLSEGFGPGFNGPFVLAIEGSSDLSPATLTNLSTAVRGTDGVAFASEAQLNPARDTAVMTVIPTTSPQDEATTELVHTLRNEVIPTAVEGTGLDVYLGGAVAAQIDIADIISQRLPFFIAFVIGLSVLLLAAIFRSIVIPIKAAIMNLLAFGASFGVIVAVFQWGWFGDLVGVAKAGPIESFLPMMFFAILFGLAMDYEMFLVSRIREEYVNRGNTHEAITHGYTITARLIASAAAIMVSVFFAFVLGDDRVIKEFGLGLGVAIFLDATVIRLFLVPSVMEFLGDWNWYMPRWLDRVLPHLNVEGSVPPRRVESAPRAAEPARPSLQPGD